MVAAHMPGDADVVLILAAVRDAEAKTSGEIVTLLTQNCGDYTWLHASVALAAAFIGTVIAVLGVPVLHPLWLVTIQAGLALLTFAALDVSGIVPRILPLAKRQAALRRIAKEQFLESNLHLTAGRSGVLIAIALDEHVIEIVADTGLSGHITDADWQKITAEIGSDLKTISPARALIRAVQACGELMAPHFPRREDDIDELPDAVLIHP